MERCRGGASNTVCTSYSHLPVGTWYQCDKVATCGINSGFHGTDQPHPTRLGISHQYVGPCLAASLCLCLMSLFLPPPPPLHRSNPPRSPSHTRSLMLFDAILIFPFCIFLLAPRRDGDDSRPVPGGRRHPHVVRQLVDANVALPPHPSSPRARTRTRTRIGTGSGTRSWAATTPLLNGFPKLRGVCGGRWASQTRPTASRHLEPKRCRLTGGLKIFLAGGKDSRDTVVCGGEQKWLVVCFVLVLI